MRNIHKNEACVLISSFTIILNAIDTVKYLNGLLSCLMLNIFGLSKYFLFVPQWMYDVCLSKIDLGINNSQKLAHHHDAICN